MIITRNNVGQIKTLIFKLRLVILNQVFFFFFFQLPDKDFDTILANEQLKT